MNRRSFFKKTIPATTIPLLLNGVSLQVLGRSRTLQTLVNYASETDHVLVLVQLNGGNDGLNTVIPLDQYSNLSKARSNILIPENKTIKINASTALHPSMTGIKSLVDEQKIGIVQSVGYPDPNFSHFRSTDIWTSASDADQTVSSGWAGRYLDEEFPDYPNGYPNSAMSDPPGISIGALVSTTMQGPAVNMGIAIYSVDQFYQLVSGGVDEAPNTPAGHELTFIRQVIQQTQQYTEAIKAAVDKATNKSGLYPSAGSNKLADQLKIVARLIAGGLKTRIYVVTLGGFDTHASQTDLIDTTTGTHANLLGFLSTALSAFQDDLRLLGIEDRVVGLTFSEFGRRIKSNSSLGTDHGAAAPLIVFGTNVNPIIHGSNPAIPDDATVNDNLPMQYDFRSVYSSILKDWFDVSDTDLRDILFKDFQYIPIIKKAGTGIEGHSAGSSKIELLENYPNPFSESTHIRFRAKGYIRLTIVDNVGREVRTLIEGKQFNGEHELVFETENLPSGVYYCRLQTDNHQEIKMMNLVR